METADIALRAQACPIVVRGCHQSRAGPTGTAAWNAHATCATRVHAAKKEEEKTVARFFNKILFF